MYLLSKMREADICLSHLILHAYLFSAQKYFRETALLSSQLKLGLEVSSLVDVG